MSSLSASLGHTGKGRVVLGPTLNTQTLPNTDEQKKEILSKFTIVGWAAFMAILGHGLDPLVRLWPALRARPRATRNINLHAYYLPTALL